MTKNYGPAVSGYDVPEGRAWETIIFEAGKPILDRELNLSQDVDGGAAQAVLRRSTPSGWISDDFVGTSDPVGAIFSPLAVADTLEIPNALTAHVNGWLLKIQHTNITGSNQVTLGSGPVGLGAQRTDLVVLEVWRRLISASPSTVGKSATARIWQQGNVATDPANDLVLNYPDDLLDVNVGSETTKRVQIQYRLRGIENINIFSFPYGLNDPAAVANSVPPSAAFPDGSATVFPYVNQSSVGDPGLWVAGDGNPANTLGTVDGYMYCIPLLAVFRRNQTAFDRRLNQNGGVASPGPSDRPDGLFSDIIVAEDLLDLRSGVSPTGWSLPELLEKNVNFMLDNTLRTEITDTAPDGGGVRGTTVFVANEVGVLPGDGITTGDTGAGPFFGQFDSVRRRFSDRSIFETVTVVVDAPFGGWLPGSVVTIDPTALTPYPYPAFNWTSYAPPTVRFLDVLRVQYVGGAPPLKTHDAVGDIDSITNLGESPILSLVITMGTPSGGVTTEPLHVTLLIGYPTGVGLATTPVDDYGANSFEFTTAPPSALLPTSFSAVGAQSLDYAHREVQLEYTTVSISFAGSADTSGPTTTLYLPERAQTVTSILINAVAVFGSVLDVTGRIITLAAPTAPGDDFLVTYTAVRPMPQANVQMNVYYRTAAPQMARNALLSGSLTVVPKVTSPLMYALTTGSGSQDEGYPFAFAYVQSGGIFPSNLGTYSGESELSGRAEISVADFNADTGLLKLPVYVPMVANPESLVFTRGLGDVDVEGRTYFKTVPPGYVPNAYSQDLSNSDRHKDIYPLLAELAADGPLGFKGQLVLILLIRYAAFDETNGVYFDADLNNNTTTASVFRVKGNLLSKRAS